MHKNNYHTLEKFYIYPQHIHIYKFEKHLHDVEEILNTNPDDFSTLNFKKYYFFKMPLCGHPQKISLTELQKRVENNNIEKLYCRICKWLINSKINYEQLARLYSVNNCKPLSSVTKRRRQDPVIFRCPDCDQDTKYDEMRWVLEGLKKGENFKKYCRKKCYSIGMKYPDLVPLWDESRNNTSIFAVQANDYNLYHRKWYFLCTVCGKPIDTPITVFNVIKNSSKCTKHKIKGMTSFAELSIFLSFYRCLSKFPYIEVNHKYKYYRSHEFDIFITVTINDVPYCFAVEIDGKHHRNRVKNDIEKNQYAANNKIHLERVRDIVLADIELENFNNIIQRTSTDKKELNRITPELLNRFIKWLSDLNIESEEFEKLKDSIIEEIKNVDVIRDERAILQQLDHSTKKLLKDDPELKPIFEQLKEDVRKEFGNFITVTEQDIKRPFVCSKCGETWEQYVYVVVRNFRMSKNNVTGCPTCANKNKEHNNKLKRKALALRNAGFTQKEIGEILRRTQPTISSWLSNM